MGTAALAATVLDHLASDPRWTVAAAVSQPDRPQGRDLHSEPTPVKVAGNRLSIPVLQPGKARDTVFISELQALAPDLIAVAAYGQILPPALLAIPRLGCLNVHTSLLPRWRGAAPIQWAMAAGDAETGVTIMQMDAGLDTGPILSQAKTPILREDTGQTLHDRLAILGGKLLVETIPDWAAGTIQASPQPVDGVTHARKITREDGQIDWSMPAAVIHNRMRAFTPWPGASTGLLDVTPPKLLKIHRAEVLDMTSVPGAVFAAGPAGIDVGCGSGALRILELQPEGGRRMTAAQFLADRKSTRLNSSH